METAQRWFGSHQSHFSAQVPPSSTAAAAHSPRRHPLARAELLKKEQKRLQSPQQPLPQTAAQLNPRGRWHEVGNTREQRDGGPKRWWAQHSTAAEVQENSSTVGFAEGLLRKEAQAGVGGS